MSRPPRPKLQKVYYDLGKNEKIEQVEFMTRNFLISGPIKRKAWKLTNKKTKILDHTCMGAELKKGEDTILAYFTSEIPVSLGPDEFTGLSGLILAIEKNGETVFLATSIDLRPPANESLSEPKDGRKVTQEEFDDILKDKVKEYEETKSSGQRTERGRR